MKYQRLTGSRRGLGKWCTLWLVDDHLLSVDSTGYSEEYTRYYLKDVQAIIARRTARGKVWNVILSLLFAVALFSAISSFERLVTSITVTAGFFVVLSGIPLLYNILRGPTCRCHIQTPLGVHELSSIGRLRTVEKVLTRIRPLIGQFQGTMSKKEIVARASNQPAGFQPRHASVKSAPGQKDDLALSGYGGGFHYAAFFLLVADAAFSIVQIFFNNRPIMAGSTVLNLGLFACLILALVKQKGYRVPQLAGKLVWTALMMMVAGALFTYFIAIFYLIREMKGAVTSQGEITRILAGIRPIDHPPYAVFVLCYAVLSACLGIAGMVSYGRGGPTLGGTSPGGRKLPAKDVAS